LDIEKKILGWPRSITRITELKLFYKDTSDQDMVVQFAANHLDDSSDTLESVTTSGNYNVATSTAKPTSIYMPPIGTYSYFVHGLFQPNIRFYGLRIKFEYTIPWYALPMYLPIIMRGQN